MKMYERHYQDAKYIYRTPRFTNNAFVLVVGLIVSFGLTDGKVVIEIPGPGNPVFHCDEGTHAISFPIWDDFTGDGKYFYISVGTPSDRTVHFHPADIMTIGEIKGDPLVLINETLWGPNLWMLYQPMSEPTPVSTSFGCPNGGLVMASTACVIRDSLGFEVSVERNSFRYFTRTLSSADTSGTCMYRCFEKDEFHPIPFIVMNGMNSIPIEHDMQPLIFYNRMGLTPKLSPPKLCYSEVRYQPVFATMLHLTDTFVFDVRDNIEPWDKPKQSRKKRFLSALVPIIGKVLGGSGGVSSILGSLGSGISSIVGNLFGGGSGSFRSAIPQEAPPIKRRYYYEDEDVRQPRRVGRTRNNIGGGGDRSSPVSPAVGFMDGSYDDNELEDENGKVIGRESQTPRRVIYSQPGVRGIVNKNSKETTVKRGSSVTSLVEEYHMRTNLSDLQAELYILQYDFFSDETYAPNKRVYPALYPTISEAEFLTRPIVSGYKSTEYLSSHYRIRYIITPDEMSCNGKSRYVSDEASVYVFNYEKCTVNFGALLQCGVFGECNRLAGCRGSLSNPTLFFDVEKLPCERMRLCTDDPLCNDQLFSQMIHSALSSANDRKLGLENEIDEFKEFNEKQTKIEIGSYVAMGISILGAAGIIIRECVDLRKK